MLLLPTSTKCSSCNVLPIVTHSFYFAHFATRWRHYFWLKLSSAAWNCFTPIAFIICQTINQSGTNQPIDLAPGYLGQIKMQIRANSEENWGGDGGSSHLFLFPQVARTGTLLIPLITPDPPNTTEGEQKYPMLTPLNAQTLCVSKVNWCVQFVDIQ